VNKLIKWTTVIIAALVVGAAISYAVTTWSQNVSWNINADTNFSVWTAATAETEAPLTLDLSVPTEPTNVNYYIQNDGNVPIRVTGAVTFTSGSATVTWNPASGYVDVPVGTVRLHIILTLTSFSTGTGDCTVTFTSATI